MTGVRVARSISEARLNRAPEPSSLVAYQYEGRIQRQERPKGPTRAGTKKCGVNSVQEASWRSCSQAKTKNSAIPHLTSSLRFFDVRASGFLQKQQPTVLRLYSSGKQVMLRGEFEWV